jgi:predicted dehydrogenase
MSEDDIVGPTMNRRHFIATTAKLAAFTIIGSSAVRGAAASSAVRVGLLGCGRRGIANASDLIETGRARIVALADSFPERLDEAKDYLDRLNASKGYSSIDRAQMFAGPTAFEKIADSEKLDAIAISSPARFHPRHFEAVVTARKHVYCETPIAIDVAGAKQVLKIGKLAEGELCLDMGFQVRSAMSFVELMKRIHNGALGTIGCGEVCYQRSPNRPLGTMSSSSRAGWFQDPLLWSITAVEHDICAIDLCNWALQAHPLKAIGRRLCPDSRNADGRRDVVFYYPGGVHVSITDAQFDEDQSNVNVLLFGSKGLSKLQYFGPCAIYGEEAWSWQRPLQQRIFVKRSQAVGAYRDNLAEADAKSKQLFVDSIIAGKFYNQTTVGVESALTAMLGREAIYRARDVTWDELLASDQSGFPGK